MLVRSNRPPKCHPISPTLPLGGDAIQEMIDQPIHQDLVQLDVGILQQRGQIVRGRSHQGILKIDDADPRSVYHEIARMVIAVDEHLRLPCQQLGDALELRSDRRLVAWSHRLAQAGRDTIFQEVVEFPHQQRHIETSVKGDASRLRRRRTLHLQQHQLIDRLTIEDSNLARSAWRQASAKRQIAEIFQIQQTGFAIVVLQVRDRHAGALQVRQHVGEGKFRNLGLKLR